MSHEEIFQQKLSTELAKKPNIKPHSLWWDIIIYSIMIMIVVGIYYFVQRGSFSLYSANRVFADVSLLLIGLSFALSGICYYWNFADHFIIYRKQLGVVGFSYAVLHASISLFLPHAKPFLFYYFSSENMLSSVFAIVALIMYLGMIIVSTKYVIQQIGGQTWRKLLRVGYIAYFLSILHFGLILYEPWILWLTGQAKTFLPPFSLFVFLAGVAVLLLRIFLWISLAHKKPVVTTLPQSNEQEHTQPLQET